MALDIRSSDLDHLAWIERHMRGSWRGKRVLDVGCGSGYVCQHVLSHGASFAAGVDILAPPGLHQDASWSFVQADLDQQRWHSLVQGASPSNGFDYILALDILEHVKSPWEFGESLFELLKPEGSLILTSPNVNSWERILRPSSWSGIIDSQHKILFSGYSLAFMLRKIGFSVSILKAPVRRSPFVSRLFPMLGGQLFCIASKN